MTAPLKNPAADPLFARAMFGRRNPKRTWEDLVVAAGFSRENAHEVLWSGSAFPFARARYVFAQLRHVRRHKKCFDDPGATCQPRGLMRYA